MEVKNNRTIELNEVQNTLKKPKKVQKAVPTIPSDEDIIKILVTQAKLIKRKSQKIQDINPIMLQNGKPVFFPNTINVIQGQAGVHKSRLGATVCSALLKKSNCQNSLLGFKSQTENENFSVLYVDTERNLSDQYPLALQSIQINAGYGIKTTPPEFDFISLLEFPRKDRFSILNKYLNYYRSIYKDRPTFIVLDVSTDCIEDFNKSDKSMELIDHMNLAINTHNVVFLCLIHENPGSEKARGHFGTELINKASTVMRVDFEKDNNGPRDVIQVRYLKCRSTAKHEPFYIRYSDEQKGLVLVDISEVETIKQNRQKTAKSSDILEYISANFNSTTEIAKTELIQNLCAYLGGSARTIETRLAEIIKMKTRVILSIDSEPYQLQKFTKKKLTFYSVTPLI